MATFLGCNPATGSAGTPYQVKGHIERGGQLLPFPRIHGRWDAAVFATHAQGDELLFKPRAPPSHPCRHAWAAPGTMQLLTRVDGA